MHGNPKKIQSLQGTIPIAIRDAKSRKSQINEPNHQKNIHPSHFPKNTSAPDSYRGEQPKNTKQLIINTLTPKTMGTPWEKIQSLRGTIPIAIRDAKSRKSQINELPERSGPPNPNKTMRNEQPKNTKQLIINTLKPKTMGNPQSLRGTKQSRELKEKLNRSPPPNVQCTLPKKKHEK